MDPIHLVVTVVIALIILIVVIGLALLAKESGSQALTKIFDISSFIKQIQNKNQ
jgi:hypothetical protein